MVPNKMLPPEDVSTYSYNPEKAKSLLKEARVKKGTRIKVIVRAGEESFKNITLLWSAELAKLGINLVIKEVTSEWAIMDDTESEYHMMSKSWSPGYPSPYEYLIFYDSRNTFAPFTGFKNPKVDEMLDQALSANLILYKGQNQC